ncbi:MAG: SusD/RagB family nutrient-binding outer membrane lipoprotein [Prolixibacteraceae bacterium]|jgi:hypothetical protein
MNKLLLYVTICLLMVMNMSCKDQLRIDERQTSFDVNYFTYSRYQLTTAIVDVLKNYGAAAKEPRKGQAMQYFMDTYSSDQITSFFTKYDADWSMDAGPNPYTSELRTLTSLTQLATDEGNLANVAAADILKCVVGAYLTEKYGDVPFSEAVQGRSGNIFPKFDTQKEIYEQMFELLDNAVTILSNSSSKGLPAQHDVLFNGDRTKWIKFANSLKFRLMVHSYEAFKKAGTDLAPEMQKIAAGNQYMSTVEDNAALGFVGTNTDDSWYLQTNWGTGNEFTEQKPTKYLIDKMVELDDPRMYVIFAPALSPISSKTEMTDETIKINGYSYNITYYPASLYANTPEVLVATGRTLTGEVIDVPYPLDAQWFGTPTQINVQSLYGGIGLPGSNGNYDNRRLTGFSKLIAQTVDDRLKATVMESSEMMFLLAEAKVKGWISSGTAADFYAKGIKLSFERWGVFDGEKPTSHIGSDDIVDNYNAYVAKVALDGSSDLDKIALQKWLSFLITNQTEAFTDYRRTGKPEFVGKIAVSFGPNSYPLRNMYPLNEESNNAEQYNLAVTALGGKDLASAKMWIFQ